MATTTLANQVVTVDTLRAKHRVTEEAKAAAWAEITAAEARFGVLNRDLAGSDLSARVVARRELPKLEREIDELTVAAVTADRIESDARDAVKGARRVELFEKKKQVIPRLAKCLLLARVEADALAAIEDAEQNEVGPVRGRVSPDDQQDGSGVSTDSEQQESGAPDLPAVFVAAARGGTECGTAIAASRDFAEGLPGRDREMSSEKHYLQVS